MLLSFHLYFLLEVPILTVMFHKYSDYHCQPYSKAAFSGYDIPCLLLLLVYSILHSSSLFLVVNASEKFSHPPLFISTFDICLYRNFFIHPIKNRFLEFLINIIYRKAILNFTFYIEILIQIWILHCTPSLLSAHIFIYCRF